MDYPALGAALGSIVGAVGAIVGGIYTGKISRRSEESKQQLAFATMMAEDAERSRRRVQEAEERGQRGWDLARYHYGLMSNLSYILNDIFRSLDGTPESVVGVCRNAVTRMAMVAIPKSLEEPLPERHDEKK